MRFLFLMSSILVSLHLNGQLIDDFSDGDFLNNPAWLGDTNDFIVNEDFALQLQSEEAGESYLYTGYEGLDSFVLNLNYKMDFNPSASNYLRIYFNLNNPDLSLATGYYIQLGENGSNDALEIYELINGTSSLIQRGIDGNVAKDPSKGDMRITFREANGFVCEVDYEGNGVYTPEVIWGNTATLNGQKYLGFLCTYTSSRVDKFFFDDISFTQYSPDISPPSIEEVLVTNSSELAIRFNESIDPNSINPLNISVDNGIGMALTAIVDNSLSNQVNATFDNVFGGGPTYELFLTGITDLSGNMISESSYAFNYAEPAQEGEIILSEILFNPIGDGPDFVEIYNNSEKILSTEGLTLSNLDKGETELIPTVQINPRQYIALTENRDEVINVYNPIIIGDNIINMNLPSFNNDDGNVSISKIGENWGESFDYDEDMHNAILDVVDGVSLERLSFNSEVNDPSNWFSSSSNNNYATPGYENSNNLGNTINNGIALESTKFSPNNDGIQDQMRLIYKVDQPGGILNLNVYDSNGYKVKTLAQSKTLGTEGVIIWGGDGESGNRLNLGIYILQGNIFFPNGDITNIKSVVSLVDFIK